MRLGSFNVVPLLAAVLAVGGGCYPSDANVRASTPKSNGKGPIARIHWIGTANLASEPNSSYLRSILALPEAVALRDDVLKKLSEAPWSHSQPTETAHSASASLLTLLRTVLANEGYLEIEPNLTMLALRLPAEQKSLWHSNLPFVLKSWPGAEPTSVENSWAITQNGRKGFIAHKLENDWALVSLGPEKQELDARLLERMMSSAPPLKAGATNNWIEAHLDLHRLLPRLGLEWPLPAVPPMLDLSIKGEGEYVRTEGKLRFSEPVPLQIEPWNIPTNLIHDPLVSFTALRGFRSLLAKWPGVWNLKLPNTPNQAFSWALNHGPMFTYAAAPMPGSVEWMDKNGPQLQVSFNTWLKKRGADVLAEYSPKDKALNWVPVPLLAPTLEGISSTNGSALLMRMGPPIPVRGRKPPPELYARVYTTEDLVYYNWEITEVRLSQWVFLAQSARVAFNRGQLPSKAAIMNFLLAAKSKMGNSVTELTRTGPDSFSLLRKSHTGLTGAEWHVLSDWLESPAFPHGFHTALKRGSDLLRYEDLQKAPPYRKTERPSKK